MIKRVVNRIGNLYRRWIVGPILKLKNFGKNLEVGRAGVNNGGL